MPISYKVIECPDKKLEYRFKPGSNSYWWALNVRHHKRPIKSVHVDAGSGFRELVRSDDNHFTCSGCGAGEVKVKTVMDDNSEVLDVVTVGSELTIGSGSIIGLTPQPDATLAPSFPVLATGVATGSEGDGQDSYNAAITELFPSIKASDSECNLLAAIPNGEEVNMADLGRSNDPAKSDSSGGMQCDEQAKSSSSLLQASILIPILALLLHLF